MNPEIVELATIGAGLLLGIAAHIVKKVIELREVDRTFSLKRYIMENPYKTFVVFVYSIGGAATLHGVGDLSFATAVITGAADNSFSGKGAG